MSDTRAEVQFLFAGRPVRGKQGDTIGMALWAAGERVLRASSRDGAPRGMFCGMGICFECLVVADGAVVRACTTPVRAGRRVERGGAP
jgi:predicted molibdopterin-dependent oxidoreductase YjgC